MNETELEQVASVRYLGSIMMERASSNTEEIRCRVASRKTAYRKVKILLTKIKLVFNLERDFLGKCCVWSVVLYGCETWLMKMKEEAKYLESFEVENWYPVVEKSASGE